ARVLRAPPCAHGVGERAEALQLCLHRLRIVRAVGHRHRSARFLFARRRGPGARPEAARGRCSPRRHRDRVSEDARVPRARVSRDRVPVRRPWPPRAPLARYLTMTPPLPLDLQLLNVCAALLLLLAFAMLSQRRVVALVTL